MGPPALAIARQIADALDAAHEQGIVHRDLKPANIVPQRDSRSGPDDVRVNTDQDFAHATALVVAFLRPHCPYVKHVRRTFAEVATAYQARDVAVVAINPNDPTAYPEDDPAGMRREAVSAGYTFPYLIDQGQDVAKAFRAACTPDFYVFDRHRRLAYRGQFDASRPKSQTPVTGADLRGALDALLGGTSIPSTQRQSVGCSIKWKSGNAPRWA